MPKIFNMGNHNFKSPNTCSDLSPVAADLRDRTGTACGSTEPDPCQEHGRKKKIGFKANCDPMQSGSIVNEMIETPQRTVINRYTSALRGCDQAMTDLFKKLIVLDEDGKAWPVPIIYGTQEKAVAMIMQNNVRKDNTLVVDRPPLPALAINQSDIMFSRERWTYHNAIMRFRDAGGKPTTLGTELKEKDTVFGFARGIPIDVSYTLYAWTKYLEDMNQIVEQVLLKFSPIAYIKILNVPWEVGVSLDSMSNNVDMEPGDKNIRVIKYQFNFTAQTYIPQPIIRNKTVLKIKTDFHNSVDESSISETYGRPETQE